MKRRVNIMALGLAVLSLITPLESICGAETTEQETVRVGLYEMDGFQYYDEYGGLCGYNIDYLELLSTITGWEYEYVAIADFQEGLDKLETEEIDLLAPAMWTEERAEQFAYSEMSFGTEYTVLVTSKDKNNLFYEDYTSFEGMDVAVVEGYPLTQYFINYMEKNDFSANLIYYDTVEEAEEAFYGGQVDAQVTSIMNMHQDQKLLARFEPQSFYYLTWKGNKDLLTKLDDAMERIQDTYPLFVDELQETYYPIYSEQFYSKAELTYISNKDVIRVAYVDDRRPLSFKGENGELQGISRVIFDRIAEISGLKFEYVALPSGSITYDYFKENDIDLITGVEYNNQNMNASGILLSTPYISSKKMMVSRKGFIFDSDKTYKIAVISGSQTLHKVLKSKYPNMEIVNYDTLEECFSALYNEEVHLLIQNQYVVEGAMSRPRYSDFVVVPVAGLNDELCFSTVVSKNGQGGMSEVESLLLISILNKAISQISDDELDSVIVSETLAHQYDLTLTDFLYNYRFTVMAAACGLLFAITFFLYVNNIKQKEREAKEKEAKNMLLQQRRYQTIIDCSEDLIYEISLNGETNIGSDRIREKFGWEIPKQVDDLDFTKAMKLLHIHPDDETKFRQTMLGGGAGHSDNLLVRIGKTDGTYLWCRLTRTLLMNDEGGLVSILGKIADVDDEVKEKEKLELKSRTDPLTGLLNKVTFQNEAEEYMRLHSTKGAAFLFLDMDYFKDVNDKLGHDMGDEVIKDTARKVQLLFANFDLVSRFGGDEFCIFVKDIPRETLLDKLEFANKKLESECSANGVTVKLSASIGAAYCTKENASYIEFFDCADAALYQAKDYGRNCFVINDLTE